MSDYSLLIDGKMVPGDQTMPVLNPATEEVLAQCPRASKQQLDKAVAAAKAAFPARRTGITRTGRKFQRHQLVPSRLFRPSRKRAVRHIRLPRSCCVRW